MALAQAKPQRSERKGLFSRLSTHVTHASVLDQLSQSPESFRICMTGCSLTHKPGITGRAGGANIKVAECRTALEMWETLSATDRCGT